jgi:hypothetical protein
MNSFSYEDSVRLVALLREPGRGAAPRRNIISQATTH